MWSRRKEDNGDRYLTLGTRYLRDPIAWFGKGDGIEMAEASHLRRFFHALMHDDLTSS